MEIKIVGRRPDIVLNRASVFAMMDCNEDSPVYDEVVGEYARLEAWLYDNVSPSALMAIESWKPDVQQALALPGIPDLSRAHGQGFLYVVMTLGKAAENYSSELFEKGDYLAGMLIGAMADDYLFQYEEAVMPDVKEMCALPGFGILRRMEAPSDIPLEFHGYVYERCGLKEHLGMSLSSGFMFDPVKTSCLVFELTDDATVFNAWHDCSRCPAVGCPRRGLDKNK